MDRSVLERRLWSVGVVIRAEQVGNNVFKDVVEVVVEHFLEPLAEKHPFPSEIPSTVREMWEGLKPRVLEIAPLAEFMDINMYGTQPEPPHVLERRELLSRQWQDPRGKISVGLLVLGMILEAVASILREVSGVGLPLLIIDALCFFSVGAGALLGGHIANQRLNGRAGVIFLYITGVICILLGVIFLVALVVFG
jgi:hypothetical protein